MSNEGLIDIGANITHPQLYNQLDKIITNIENSNTNNVIITSSNLSDTKLALEIINKYPGIFYTTVGYHPHNAKDFSQENIRPIKDYTQDKNIIAIGECGLDYYREYSSRKEQEFCFEQQLVIAKDIGLPVFLHERHAHKDFVKILGQHINDISNSVVHCFTGNKDELSKYLDMGCYIGITGWISDIERGSHLLQLLKYIPTDRLMIETDSPYLTPKNLPFNNDGVNQPSYLSYVAETVAECLNKDIEFISNITSDNTKRFFSI